MALPSVNRYHHALQRTVVDVYFWCTKFRGNIPPFYLYRDKGIITKTIVGVN